MHLAYLLMIHKNFNQFKRLFHAIHERSNVYVVHVDAKSDQNFHLDVKAFLQSFPNAHLLPSQPCIWGGFSMVEIELKAMQLLLDLDLNWDFLINLSGQDFPLKTQAEIKSFLNDNRESNFITVFDDDFISQWCTPYTLFRPRSSSKNFLNARSRIEYSYLEVPFLSKLIWIPFKRQFLKNTDWYAGWQWFILNRKFCEYVSTSSELEEYIRFFRHTFIPDESFFQTFIMNSMFRDSVVNDFKRAVFWNSDKGVKILRKDDFDRLIPLNCFFARKFDERIDEEIIGQLESYLFSSSYQTKSD